MKIGVAKRHFGTEQSVQQPEIRSIDDDAPAVREFFGKDLIEVVAHLSFQHHAMAESHAQPDTNPGKICIRLREPEIVRIGSDREVVLRKCRRCPRYAAQQEEQRNTPHLASPEQFRFDGERTVGCGLEPFSSCALDAGRGFQVAKWIAVKTRMRSSKFLSPLTKYCVHQKFAVDDRRPTY
jgi:hypothetical protein